MFLILLVMLVVAVIGNAIFSHFYKIPSATLLREVLGITVGLWVIICIIVFMSKISG